MVPTSLKSTEEATINHPRNAPFKSNDYKYSHITRSKLALLYFTSRLSQIPSPIQLAMAKFSDESQSKGENSWEEEQLNNQMIEEEDDDALEVITRTAADSEDDDAADAADDQDDDDNEVKLRSLSGFVVDLSCLCVFNCVY